VNPYCKAGSLTNKERDDTAASTACWKPGRGRRDRAAGPAEADVASWPIRSAAPSEPAV